jgi:hypothetical protein
VAAGAAHRAPASPDGPPSQPTQPTGILAFEPAFLDLGDAEQGRAAVGRVRVRNASPAPVRLVRVTSTCACLAAIAPAGEIAAGGTVEVEVSLTPGTKPGSAVSKSLTFEVDGRPPSTLAVRAMVIPRRMLPPWALPAAGALLGMGVALLVVRRRLSPRPSS